jgi:hypothetical protein
LGNCDRRIPQREHDQEENSHPETSHRHPSVCEFV